MINKHIRHLFLVIASIFTIQQTETSFISKLFGQKKFSAGILPLVHDKGQFYFLLGKEYCTDEYSSNGSYSDFGGASDPADNQDWQTTALREFEEELGFKRRKKHNESHENPLIKINGDWITVEKNIPWERALSPNKLNDYNHVFNEQKSYYMILLEIDRERLNDNCFKTALTLRDGEKSIITLFPAGPFLEWIENLTISNACSFYHYSPINKQIQNTTGATISPITYQIRASFAKSLQSLLTTSTTLQTIKKERSLDTLVIEIIDERINKETPMSDILINNKSKDDTKKNNPAIKPNLYNYVPLFILMLLLGIITGAYLEYNNILKSSGIGT